MNPPFSAIFLTTLIGAGQGLFLMLYASEWLARPPLNTAAHQYLGWGSALALAFTGGGLIASFFHLGQPQRAWRGMTQWRTSWLAREGIALPLFMLGTFVYGVMHLLELSGTRTAGAITALICLALFVCTGMIYACIRFLQEWATALTPINYVFLGCASGAMLAIGFAVLWGPDAHELLPFYRTAAVALTLFGMATRAASLVRNARIKSKSTVQSAIGIKHPQITQKAQGFMGGSFNTREFFHGQTRSVLRSVKSMFLLFAFVVPIGLMALSALTTGVWPLLLAFPVQYVGLVAERWFFFAQANHPQNLYYQTIS